MQRKSKRLSLCCAFFSAILANANAAIVLDQSFTDTSWQLSAPLGSPECDYIAQSFTSGITGELREIRMGIRGENTVTAPQLRVTIFAAPGGVPSSTALGSAMVHRNGSLPLKAVQFSTSIPMHAGSQYLIGVECPDQVAPPGETYGAWIGRIDDGYKGGQMHFGRLVSPEFISWTTTGFGYDAFFQTYVEPIPVPEPCGLAIWLPICVLRLERSCIPRLTRAEAQQATNLSHQSHRRVT
jgi:hypothetical protein